MATWIVHLRLAENLLDMIDGIDPVHFVIGSIAPDSGIPDEKWEKFDPPGELLHFHLQDSPLWRSADLEFYRQYLQDFPDERKYINRFSFLIGYFFHLITDNFWDNKIDKPTRTKYSAEFGNDSQFVWEVKRDWYGLDFIYLRDNPKSIFHRIFLECNFNCNYLDFLPVEAVHQRVAYIREFYQRKDEKIQVLFKRPYIYLSQVEMETFVKYTTKVLHQIYNNLWIKKKEIPETFSVLDYPNEWFFFSSNPARQK